MMFQNDKSLSQNQTLSFWAIFALICHLCLFGWGWGVLGWEHLQIFLKVLFSKCWKALSKVTCGRLMCERFHSSTWHSAPPFLLWLSCCILLIFKYLLLIYNANFSRERWEIVHQKGRVLDYSNKRSVIKTPHSPSHTHRKGKDKRSNLVSKSEGDCCCGGFLFLGITASLIKNSGWTRLLE